MRILVATSHRGVVGGAETYLRAVLPLLRDRGHEIALLCVYGAEQGAAAIDDLCPNLPIWNATPDGLPVEVARWQADVVFAHQFPDPAVPAMLTSRFRTVFYAHNHDGCCISGTKFHAATGWPCTRRLGPACLGLYLPLGCGGSNPVTAIQLYRRERNRQQLFPKYQATLVASRYMAEEVVRNGSPADRVRIVPYPLTASPDPSPPAPRPTSDRVLFVGRMTALKGWDHLVEALPLAAEKLGRELTLVAAGDGPDRVRFEAATRRRNLRAEFLGWVGADRREHEMRKADILAVPSVWPEPFGLVGVEAGCVGLPSVGYAAGGITDWLIPGVTGEAAPADPPRPNALAEAFVRALSDSGHLHRLAIGAWEMTQKFTASAHLDRLIPILEAAAAA